MKMNVQLNGANITRIVARIENGEYTSFDAAVNALLTRALDTELPEAVKNSRCAAVQVKEERNKLTAFSENEKVIEIVRRAQRRAHLKMCDVFELLDHMPVGVEFSLHSLVLSLGQLNINGLITDRQLKGWHGPFHKFVRTRIHFDFNSNVTPIRYWRKRED